MNRGLFLLDIWQDAWKVVALVDNKFLSAWVQDIPQLCIEYKPNHPHAMVFVFSKYGAAEYFCHTIKRILGSEKYIVKVKTLYSFKPKYILEANYSSMARFSRREANGLLRNPYSKNFRVNYYAVPISGTRVAEYIWFPQGKE
ncbi:MAG: hypothetical protein WC449_05275 [Candidatus Paceibacterota bacterium]